MFRYLVIVLIVIILLVVGFIHYQKESFLNYNYINVIELERIDPTATNVLKEEGPFVNNEHLYL